MPRRRVSVAEIVTCVVITAILVFIFWPVSGEPSASKTRVCMSNVKQIAVGMLIYLSDENDRLPPGPGWMDSLSNYTKQPQIYHCPAVKDGGYGYALSSSAQGLHLTSAEGDAKILLLFETTLLQRSAVSSFATVPNPPRHGGQNWVAYGDSSVRPYPNP